MCFTIAIGYRLLFKKYIDATLCTTPVTLSGLVGRKKETTFVRQVQKDNDKK